MYEAPTHSKVIGRIAELRLHELPVLPAVVVRLMSQSPDSEELFDEVLDVARQEPGFALRVVRMANSAMSSPASPIETLERAVVRLGANHVADLLTTVAITRVFVPRTVGERSMWRHAIEVATASQAMIRSNPVEGISPEHAYLAGLLHDIGRFVLFDQASDLIQKVDDLSWTTPHELIEAEREVCGTDHAEVGSQVCAHWSVPESIVSIVKNHHRPLDEVGSALLAVVEQADWLSVWWRSHGETEDALKPLQEDIPPDLVASIAHAPRLTAVAIAQLRPEAIEASERAARALGLVRR